MSYLQSTAEEWTAQWVMHNPDGISELNAYWFHSPIGKVIVWACINAKKRGPVTLDTIKQHAKHRGATTNEMIELVWSRPTIHDDSMYWCLRYFKTLGMLFDLYEARLDDKWTPTETETVAIQKINGHLKSETDSEKMHEWIKAKWMKVFETKAKHLGRSQVQRINDLTKKEEEILNKFKTL